MPTSQHPASRSPLRRTSQEQLTTAAVHVDSHCSELASCLMGTSGTPLQYVWVCSFIKPDLFDNNVPFDNTTLNQSALEIRVRIRVILEELHFSLAIFTEGKRTKRTHPNDQQQNKITHSRSTYE